MVLCNFETLLHYLNMVTITTASKFSSSPWGLFSLYVKIKILNIIYFKLEVLQLSKFVTYYSYSILAKLRHTFFQHIFEKLRRLFFHTFPKVTFQLLLSSKFMVQDIVFLFSLLFTEKQTHVFQRVLAQHVALLEPVNVSRNSSLYRLSSAQKGS